jgi:methionine-S-sulfoxide reductase
VNRMRLTKITGSAVAVLLAAGLMAVVRNSAREQPRNSSTSQSGFMSDIKKPNPEQSSTDNPGAASTRATAPSKRETAVLAGGCFWGMEEILRKIPGVLETAVGYTGGSVPNPTYQQVCTGRTGHAEGIRVVFDPSTLTYEQLLGYFFRMHDPTTLNQQHNDIGTQYRSAIFYTSEEQKQIAGQVMAQVDKSGKFKRPVVTELAQASTFYPAEDYHQKYLIKNPGGYTCHILRD